MGLSALESLTEGERGAAWASVGREEAQQRVPGRGRGDLP